MTSLASINLGPINPTTEIPPDEEHPMNDGLVNDGSVLAGHQVTPLPPDTMHQPLLNNNINLPYSTVKISALKIATFACGVLTGIFSVVTIALFIAFCVAPPLAAIPGLIFSCLTGFFLATTNTLSKVVRHMEIENAAAIATAGVPAAA